MPFRLPPVRAGNRLLIGWTEAVVSGVAPLTVGVALRYKVK